MNAHATIAPEALALAATNEAILRALDPAPIAGDAAVAKAAGVDGKNVGRQLKLLQGHGLVEKLNSLTPPLAWSITVAGRAALRAIDLANGRVAAGDDAAPADPSALLLLHHQIRPNPLQPRKLKLGQPGQEPPTRDRVELDQLKASIAASLARGGPGVLQNLNVYPADADGIHTLSAGERRWVAVGELIAEGVWPADKRLRAVQDEASAGQTAFVALVENGQRANLSMIEEARAFAELVDDTGWSARHAALQTGRDPRSVQQMLQVLRDADPDAIARHEANPDAYTWEDLRRSVQKPTEGEGEGREPAQADLEDVVLPYTLDDHAQGNIDYHAHHLEKLSARKRLMVIELADKIFREPFSGRPRATRGAAHCEGADPDVIMAGVGISWDAVGSIVSLSASTMEVLRRQGALPYGPGREAALKDARTAAGVAAARIESLEASGDGYVTPWLNPPWEASDDQPPAPQRAGYEPDALARLALAELAHKVQTAGEHNGWAQVRQYWRDQTFSELKTAGLVAVTHSLEGGPHAQLTGAGEAVLTGIAGLLDDVALDRLRFEARLDPEDGQPYATPWLNNLDAGNAALPQVSTSEIVNAMGDDDDAEDVDTPAAGLLARVRETLNRHSHTAAEIRELLGEAGLQRPFMAVQDEHDASFSAGVIVDIDGDEAAVTDSTGEMPHALAIARAELIAYALNLASGGDAVRNGTPSPRPEPLFALYPGDMVSVGGTASAYRLISVDRDDGLSGPAFLAQGVRLSSGKNYGEPRQVTLHAMQRVVRRATA